jgi:uncharacterized protein YjbJ (UPF0337 family)
MGIFDKVKDALGGHQDKVDAAVDKAGDIVDERTESKYADQVDQIQDVVKDRLGNMTDDQPEEPA